MLFDSEHRVVQSFRAVAQCKHFISFTNFATLISAACMRSVGNVAGFHSCTYAATRANSILKHASGNIQTMTLAVLNPLRATEQTILQDTDMAGPLVFCLALGGFLLLSGKVTFSYIYGIGVMGCIAFYCLLSLMATQAQVTFGAVVSVLGYCLLPMVVLSGINVLITIQGTLGLVVAGVAILWCAISASKLFVTAYSMDHQQVLIAYPCALLYGVFALITIF